MIWNHHPSFQKNLCVCSFHAGISLFLFCDVDDEFRFYIITGELSLVGSLNDIKIDKKKKKTLLIGCIITNYNQSVKRCK